MNNDIPNDRIYNRYQPTNPNVKQKVELYPKLGGFLWAYIILSLPGFIMSLIWTIATILLVIGLIFGLAGLNNKKSEDTKSFQTSYIKNGPSDKTVLVYDLQGMITTGGKGLPDSSRNLGIYTDIVAKDFEEIKKDNNIKNVVFRFNTPGGEEYASEILGDLIADLLRNKNQKQAVFYFDQLVASGGLWASYKNTENYVIGSNYGETGSIGVYISIPNFKGTAEKIGYSQTVIKSAQNKDIGNPFRDMTPDEVAHIQAQVDKSYDRFLNIVSAARKVPKDKVKTFATGFTYPNDEAKNLGLIDELGDIGKAADKAASNANLGSDYSLVEIKTEPNFVDSILGGKNTLGNMLGLPQTTTKALDRLTTLESGKMYLIDEYKI